LDGRSPRVTRGGLFRGECLEDAAHFNRLFKALYGITPGAAKRRGMIASDAATHSLSSQSPNLAKLHKWFCPVGEEI